MYGAEISKYKLQGVLRVCKTVCKYHGFILWKLWVWSGAPAVCTGISENALLDKTFQAPGKCWVALTANSTREAEEPGVHSVFYFEICPGITYVVKFPGIVSLSSVNGSVYTEIKKELTGNWTMASGKFFPFSCGLASHNKLYSITRPSFKPILKPFLVITFK